ncbi:MAG: RNA methyltransferase [Nanoarchaeota archaeon]|nr:RNA methyltransferase [Nanoarchaeota archaeon]
MIKVVLLEPETAGNVGAVARVMMNFGFTKLVLINPHCDHLSDEARNRAKHAKEVLEGAEVNDFFVVDDYDYLIATTARLGTDYNITRSPLKPEELAGKLKKLSPEKKIGLVIGREGHGMFNEEIGKCDFVVTVPSAKEYPTLNISHAVVIILYEIHKALAQEHIVSHIAPIGKPEKDQIMKMFNQIFNSMQWETPEKKETQQILWKKTIGKAMLTRREAYGVMGFLRKVMHQGERMKKESKTAKSRTPHQKGTTTKKPSANKKSSGRAATRAKNTAPKPRNRPKPGTAKR